MTIFLADTSLNVIMALFLLAATVVWFSGARLTHVADELSDRWRLSKSLVGLLILSTATSLPEVATTLSAAARQAQALVLSNLFGGIAFQTAILSIADFWVRGAITYYPRRLSHVLEAGLLLMLLTLTATVIVIGEPFSAFSIGAGSLLIAAGYAFAIGFLRRRDPEGDWVPVKFPEEVESELQGITRPRTTNGDQALVAQGVVSAIAIFLFGLLLVLLAEEISTRTGLASGFIGVTLLAAATSLPEMTTSIAAVRAGAYTLAISNIFGSNLIMLVLVLPADVLYRDGPILSDTGPLPMLSLMFGSLVTAVYLVGLIARRKPRIAGIGADSAVVLAVFAISLAAYFFNS